MSLAMGLDFGSRGYRAAYVLDGEVISVPGMADPIWWSPLFIEQDPHSLPFGFTFSSLKYEIGTGRRFPWNGENRLPEEVAIETLRSLKMGVEAFAGEVVNSVTIAVPAQYSTRRRSLLRELAQTAGFGYVDLINDTTAASLGFLHGFEGQSKTLLVFSMGYIGFEVALVRSARQRLRELTHEGARNPSGRDFDLQVMHATLEALQQRRVVLPIRAYTRQWFDLALLASDVKERLTLDHQATMELPAHLTGATAVRMTFESAGLEKIISLLIEPTMAAVQRSLDDADARREDIDQVLLVGGSAHLGPIQSSLAQLFGERLVMAPMQVIAQGAAIQADRLARQPDRDTDGAAAAVAATLAPPSPSAPPVALANPRPPAQPDLDVLSAYVFSLIEAGEQTQASAFLGDLEHRLQALRERVSASLDVAPEIQSG